MGSIIAPPTIRVETRCRIFEPNYRIIRAQFDLDPHHKEFGEYIVTNLMRERGELQDGWAYRAIFEPIFRR